MIAETKLALISAVASVSTPATPDAATTLKASATFAIMTAIAAAEDKGALTSVVTPTQITTRMTTMAAETTMAKQQC